MAKTTKLFEELLRQRDIYRDTVSKAAKDRDFEIKNAEMVYQPGSLSQKRSEINDKFNKRLAEAARVFGSVIDPLIEEAESSARFRCSSVRPEKIAELRSIADLPFTAGELHLIAPKYVGNYYTSKLIATIAEKNSIAAEDLNFTTPPSYDLEMTVLNEIKTAVVEYCSSYNGSDDSDTIPTRMILSDKRIQKWEDAVSSGLTSEKNMTDEHLAHRAFTKITSCMGEDERALAIKREVDAIRPSARIQLLSQIANSHIIGDTAILGSGYSAEIREIRETGKSKMFEDAKKALATVTEALEQNEYSGVMKLDDMRADAKRDGNVYFETMVSSAAKDNSKLADAASLVDGVRGSHLAGENKAD